MLLQADNLISEPDEWASRCNYWQTKADKQRKKRKRREKESHALILIGQGLSMNVDKGRLIVRDGLTHYPQKRREYVFYKGSLDLPSRILVIDGSGSITLDALDWLANQQTSLIRLRYDGTVSSVMSPSGYSSDPEKFAWQIRARDDDAERLKFYRPIMRKKLANAIETLEGFFKPSKPREAALTKLSDYVERIDNEPLTLKSLLGMEAQAASLYFQTWRTIEINWKVTKRNPIPDEWLSFYSRGSLKMKNKGGANIFATHPINAMLNYAYTVLLSQTQIQVIADGYDPMLGVIHKRSRSLHGPTRPSFAIDMMEPMRPVVDRVILKLIDEETFSGADFDLQSDGVVRVNPELVKMLLGNQKFATLCYERAG